MSANRSRGNGECSGSSGNGGEDSEGRPLKKARYAWQVKGKCRARAGEASSSVVPASAPASSTSEQNLKELEGYLLKRDLTEVPESRVTCMRRAEEARFLKDWQSIQMAVSNVDNIINSVLDCGTPQERMAVFHPFALLTDLEDGLAASPSVENEGILMAISAHGLQHTSVPSAWLDSSDSESSDDSEASNSAARVEDLMTPRAEPEHAQIIEEAIAFAIQNKGLCWGYDYHNDVIIDNESRD